MAWIVAENLDDPSRTHVTNGARIFHTDEEAAKILCSTLNGDDGPEAAEQAFNDAVLLADTGDAWQPPARAVKK